MTRALIVADPGAHFSAEPDFVDSWPPHRVRPEIPRFGTSHAPGLGLHILSTLGGATVANAS